MKNNNPLVKKFPEPMPWDCVKNHLPIWTDDRKIEMLISDKDNKQLMSLLDAYNNLLDKEDSLGVDAHALYGIEDEKKELIDSMMKIFNYYKDIPEKGPDFISHLLYPNNEEKRKVWLHGYSYATRVFNKEAY